MVQRPRIGLSANLADPDPDRPFYPPFNLVYVEESMAALFARTGALVYAVPPPIEHPGAVSVADVIADLDGLVITGGADVAPTTYGHEPQRPQWAGQARRDAYEIALVHAALDVGVPVLGICRGHQLLNVALGGTLIQDIATEVGDTVTHRDQHAYHHIRHRIELMEGSALARHHHGTTASVNSIHHQAIGELAADLVIEAVCPDDGIIEAVRLAGSAEGSNRWAAGVQWHPEFDFVTAQTTGLPDDHLDATPLITEFLTTARNHLEQRP